MNPDKRMLRFIDLLMFEKKIKFNADFCKSIDMRTQTLTKIRNGDQHFTLQQVQKACEVYNLNANWVFGIKENVYNTKNSIKLKDI